MHKYISKVKALRIRRSKVVRLNEVKPKGDENIFIKNHEIVIESNINSLGGDLLILQTVSITYVFSCIKCLK